MTEAQAAASFSASGSMTITACHDGSVAQLAAEAERLRMRAVRAREEWEESKAAGGTDGTAGAQFSVYYRAEQDAERAYLAWVQALRTQLIGENVYAGYGGPAFISGMYPASQQPPSEN